MSLDSYYNPLVMAIHERYSDPVKAKDIVYALHDDKSLERFAIAAMKNPGSDQDAAVEQFMVEVYERFGKPENS